MIVPVGNQVLIEVLNEYAAVSSVGQDGQKGIVREVSVDPLHLTASTGFEMSTVVFEDKAKEVTEWIGKTVRYALYADMDSSKWKEDGKNWVVIPWYRVLGVESDVPTTTDTSVGKIEPIDFKDGKPASSTHASLHR